jgi:hypothetical protein
MAKKMQRLDESPDFRPFKFRIQAFTNAFLEEVIYSFCPRVRMLTKCSQLARQGYPEEKIPMKKVKQPDHPPDLVWIRFQISCSILFSDSKFPMEPALHFTIQRGGQEVQVKGEPYLAC